MKRSKTKSAKHARHSQQETPNASRSRQAPSAGASGNRNNKHRSTEKRSRPDIRPPAAAVDGMPDPEPPDGGEEITQIRDRIRELLSRCDGMSKEIDSAFGGQPFLPGLDPLDAANQRRFWTYFYEHKKVTKLLLQALQLWEGSFGGKTGIM